MGTAGGRFLMVSIEFWKWRSPESGGEVYVWGVWGAERCADVLVGVSAQSTVWAERSLGKLYSPMSHPENP